MSFGYWFVIVVIFGLVAVGVIDIGRKNNV